MVVGVIVVVGAQMGVFNEWDELCKGLRRCVCLCVYVCVCCSVHPALPHTGHLSDKASSGSDAAEGLP